MTEKLWFDVGIKRYTTSFFSTSEDGTLWFDVGIKRYTTNATDENNISMLWFDVGIKRYTTHLRGFVVVLSCGLM